MSSSIRPSTLPEALFSHPGQVGLAALTTPGPKVQAKGPEATSAHWCYLSAEYQPLASPGLAGRGRYQLYPYYRYLRIVKS